jgi:undecaprenyl diphosphate synthase
MSESLPKTLYLASEASPPEHGVKHLAIIMDGNHRWAKARHLPKTAGHRAGAKNVVPLAEACADAGIECLTLFAFSTENWARPRREVNLLMELMRGMLENDVNELNRRGVRLNVIGDRSRFAPDLQEQMNRAEDLTRHNNAMHLNIAANFGGRWDILQAAKQLARDFASGRLDDAALDGLTEDGFTSYLSLGTMLAPDLCVRTGGDQRISNFLLWDFAYTEFYFTDTYFPDFDASQLRRALESFSERQRRFGRRP